jgi:hypothetical protein
LPIVCQFQRVANSAHKGSTNLSITLVEAADFRNSKDALLCYTGWNRSPGTRGTFARGMVRTSYPARPNGPLRSRFFANAPSARNGPPKPPIQMIALVHLPGRTSRHCAIGRARRLTGGFDIGRRGGVAF